jgi:hypothetical protein
MVIPAKAQTAFHINLSTWLFSRSFVSPAAQSRTIFLFTQLRTSTPPLRKSGGCCHPYPKLHDHRADALFILFEVAGATSGTCVDPAVGDRCFELLKDNYTRDSTDWELFWVRMPRVVKGSHRAEATNVRNKEMFPLKGRARNMMVKKV